MISKITCPYCEKESGLTQSNPYRPFCSKRCKLLDFGGWATEKYNLAETKTEYDIHPYPKEKN